MLARLNRRLTGHTDGGFVTCLCCLIDPDGRLTLSNAGHLAPYRNGEEVPCGSGLPLGLVAGAEYDETGMQLNEGDTVTFLSDRVVEARNTAGELFGFERARAASAQKAIRGSRIRAFAVMLAEFEKIKTAKKQRNTVGESSGSTTICTNTRT